MKKGKLLVLAALISCSSILAACGGSETSSSSEEPSSSIPASEPDSSLDSSSDDTSSDDISSEDSSSFDEISSEDSSSEDSSSEEITSPSGVIHSIVSIDNYYSNYITEFSLHEGDEYEGWTYVSYTFKSSSYSGDVGAYYIGVNGSVTNPTSVEGEEYAWTFTGSLFMPDDDANITLAWRNNSVWSSGNSNTHYTVHYENDNHITWLTIADDTQYYGSFDAAFARTPGVKITSVEYSIDNATWSSFDSYYTYNYNIDAYYVSFYPTGFNITSDIYLRVNYETASTVSLSLVNEDQVNIADTSCYASVLTEGDSVSIRYTAAGTNRYVVEATIEGAESITSNTASETGYSLVSFVAGTSDITVTFNIERNTNISLTADESNEYLSEQVYYTTNIFTTEPVHAETATLGSTVYVCTRPVSGYTVTSIYINDGKYTPTYYAYYDIYYVTYTIPEEAESVYAYAETATAYTASTDIDSEYASVSFGSYSGSKICAEGDTVSFTISPTFNYTVTENSVTVKDALGNTVDASVTYSDGSASGSFTMPASDVTVSCGFDEKAATDSTVTIVNDSGASISIVDSSTYLPIITASGNYTGTITSGSKVQIQNGSEEYIYVSCSGCSSYSEMLEPGALTSDIITVTGDLTITVTIADFGEDW